MNKKIYLALLMAGLAGCALNPVPNKLNVTEKQLVESGKEVRITEYQEDTNFSDDVFGVYIPRIKQGIFVCATPISDPTTDTPCYPQLSQYFGHEFERRGVKVAASKANADAIVFATVKYGYLDVFASSGDDYQKKIMDNLEQSLASGKGPILTMKQLPGEKFYKTDRASIDKENGKERLEGTLRTAGYAAVAIASALMGQPGAGAQASEALRGATQSGGVQGSGMVVDKSEKVLMISFHGLNLTQVTHDKVIAARATPPIAYIYKGPVNATVAFPDLFNEALDISLKRFIIYPS